MTGKFANLAKFGSVAAALVLTLLVGLGFPELAIAQSDIGSLFGEAESRLEEVLEGIRGVARVVLLIIFIVLLIMFAATRRINWGGLVIFGVVAVAYGAFETVTAALGLSA